MKRTSLAIVVATLIGSCAGLCVGLRESSGRGHVRGHARITQLGSVSTPAPTNVIDSYTWDLAWSGEDALVGSWPGLAGTPTPTATAIDTPTLDLSTTGFTPAGIGASRVDKAVRAGAGGGYTVTGQDWPGGIFHLRLLIIKVNFAGSDEYLFRAYKDGDERVDAYLYSANALRAYIDDTGSAAAFQVNSAVMSAGPQLIDIVYDPTGASGSGRIIYRINGSETSTNDNESLDFADVGGVGFYPLGGATDPTSTSSLLFVGVRFLSASTDFTLAQHQADATALGL